jgi:hypothetical protein
MTEDNTRAKGLRTFPAPARGFDFAAASDRELIHHGIPRKPDVTQEPGLAAIWEQRARRYREFDHLDPQLIPPDVAIDPDTSSITLSPSISAGFELFSPSPITVLTGSWTVPNLRHTQAVNHPLHVRTFFGLGFLDVHVEMTVDTSHNATAEVRIHTGAQVAIPVRPGDYMSAVLCLQANVAGTAFYGLVNETSAQTINFTFDTGFPPAVVINAGVSRGSAFNGPPDPLARFGAVYFDELVAYSTGGTRILTNGVATTMVDRNGTKLATPYRMTEYAFKVVPND